MDTIFISNENIVSIAIIKKNDPPDNLFFLLESINPKLLINILLLILFMNNT